MSVVLPAPPLPQAERRTDYRFTFAQYHRIVSRTEGLPVLPLTRFSLDQYHKMITDRILKEDDRVELLDGLVINKMTHKPPHDVCIDLAQGEIAALLGDDWRIRIQSAITLPQSQSEPEPDIAVVLGPARRYVKNHPGPNDIGLVVEVSDTTLDLDQQFKGPLYARARIAFYWIINLVDRQVEVYSQPRGGKNPAYKKRQDYGEKAAVPLLLKKDPGAQVQFGMIAVKDLLP